MATKVAKKGAAGKPRKKKAGVRKVSKKAAKNLPSGAASKAGAGAAHEPVRMGKGKRAGVVVDIPVSKIHVEAGFNPRHDASDYTSLTAAIKRQGLLNPITVRDRVGGGYFVVAGERRFRACKALGYDAIPCVVRADLAGDDAEALAVSVGENAGDVRTNLSHLDLGFASKRLIDSHNWTITKVASETGVNARMVRRCVQLADAPDDVRAALADGTMSEAAALQFGTIDDEATRKAVWDQLRGLGDEPATAARIKELAKKAARDAGASALPGVAARGKRGVDKSAALLTWRSRREKQAVLAYACHVYVDDYDNQDLGGDHEAEAMRRELLGIIGYGLWDRGDVDEPYPPNEKGDAESAAAFSKRRAVFLAHMRNCAAGYVPGSENDGASGVGVGPEDPPE